MMFGKLENLPLPPKWAELAQNLQICQITREVLKVTKISLNV